MIFNKKKGLGMAATDWGTKPKSTNPRPGSESRMPYKPGTGQTKTMPYTPGTGSMQTMPYRPKPKMKPMSYDNEPMDMGWESETPPGYATMEYKRDRDGTADSPIPNYEGEGVGAENMDGYNRDAGGNDWGSPERFGDEAEHQGAVEDIQKDAWERWPYNEDNYMEARDMPSPQELEAWKDSWRKRLRSAGVPPDEIEAIIDEASPKEWQD